MNNNFRRTLLFLQHEDHTLIHCTVPGLGQVFLTHLYEQVIVELKNSFKLKKSCMKKSGFQQELLALVLCQIKFD